VALVMRGVRRSGTAVPEIGDEAWAGPGWVLGRQGDTMVRLNLEPSSATVPASANPLPALLATALGRL